MTLKHEMKNALFILNPTAGKRRASTHLDQIVSLFEQNGYRVNAHVTGKPGDAARFAEQLAPGCDLVVCCGGDGTLHEVVNGLLRTDIRIPLGYLPAGTTNDMARALRLPGNVQKAALVAMSGHTAAQDIGSFNENRFFSYVASFGAFTSIPYTTPQWLKNRFGYLAYLLQILRCLPELRPYTLKLDTDGLHDKGHFLFGSVSNAYSLSGIFQFKPEDVCLDDGAFELILIRCPKNPLDFLQIASNLIRRKSDGHFVIFRHVRRIDFQFAEETAWTVDGENGGKCRSVRIRNLPRALSFVSNRAQSNA
ncbi:MAG: diacylglycerol kinase family protein [Ethanoligenens sp.]